MGRAGRIRPGKTPQNDIRSWPRGHCQPTIGTARATEPGRANLWTSTRSEKSSPAGKSLSGRSARSMLLDPGLESQAMTRELGKTEFDPISVTVRSAIADTGTGVFDWVR